MAAKVDSKEVKSTTESEKESFWTGGRIAITLIIGGLLIWWGISRWTTPSVPNVAKPASVTTKTAPLNPSTTAFVPLPAEVRDTSLRTLNGNSLKLSDFSNKVVVLNIWATWCGPCRMEMPELVKMNNEYKDRGLVVLGLATTYNEQRGGEEGVKEYIKQNNIPYEIIWDDGTLAGPLVEAVQGRSVIPQSFVISRDGNIVKHFTGFNVYQTPQLMRQAIEEALGDKGKA